MGASLTEVKKPVSTPFHWSRLQYLLAMTQESLAHHLQSELSY